MTGEAATEEGPARHRLPRPESRTGWLIAGLVVLAVVSCVGLFWQGRGGSDEAAAAGAPEVTFPPSTAPDLSDPDVRFWQTITQFDTLATQVPGRANATNLAREVCAAIQPSMTTEEAQGAAAVVLTAAAVRPEVAPYWMGASTAAYCPEFSTLITGE